MTDTKTDSAVNLTPAAADPVQTAVASLEARLTELENVVHALAPIAHGDHHGVILPWLEKIGARIKAAVESL